MIVDQFSKLQVVIDTDAANETDDQFAIVYALLAPERLQVHSIHAAPFLHCRVNSSAEGMLNSLDEVRRILDYFPNQRVAAFPGSRNFLHCEEARMNAAVGNLIALAMRCTPEEPLHVVAIAALTNIGAALQLVPEIAPRMVVHWLGSHSYEQAPAEFNLEQDTPAAALLFNSKCRIRLYPCAGVAEKLAIFPDEVELLISDCGALGRFLRNRYQRQHFFAFGSPLRFEHSLSLWDIAPFAGIIVPETVQMKRTPRRQLQVEPLQWGRVDWELQDEVCTDLDPLAIYRDFRRRLVAHAASTPHIGDNLF